MMQKILIIIVSVSIFGLLLFAYVRNQIKKRRIGPNREEDNRILFYKKDMSILARSGFNYETSKKVLDLSKKDYEKLLRLLWSFVFFVFSFK